MYTLMTQYGSSNAETGNKNAYKTVSGWEDWATEHLPQRFGLDVVEVCHDRKRNHDEGTDAFIKNFCGKRFARVDFKWNRIFNYKKVFFALEDKHVDGTSWVDNQTAIDLDVLVLHPWKGLWDHTYKLCAYRLKDLHNIAERKRLGCVSVAAIGTGTKYWALSELDLQDVCIWDSGFVNLAEEEAMWKSEKRR